MEFSVERPCCPELVGTGCSSLVSRSSGGTWGTTWFPCGETTSAEQRLCDTLDRSRGSPQDLDQESWARPRVCFSVPKFDGPASTTPRSMI